MMTKIKKLGRYSGVTRKKPEHSENEYDNYTNDNDRER